MPSTAQPPVTWRRRIFILISNIIYQ
jgi:hypothetical protein